MFFGESFIPDLIALFLTLGTVYIAYFKWIYVYWKHHNLPYLEPTIPFGNLPNITQHTATIGVIIKGLYERMKAKGWKHGGMYMLATPTYMVLDLDYVKNVLTKDFKHFVDRGTYHNEKVDPLSAHLFAIGGTKWRNLRTKLTPTFTSGKMKMMFQTLADCEVNLQEKVAQNHNNGEPVDIKDVLGCYTTDIIGSCAFGLECNAFKNEDSPFRKYGKKFFQMTTIRRLQGAFFMNFPNAAKVLRMRFIPKDVSDFYMKVIKDTVEYRENNGYTRKDFMQLLIDLKNNKVAEEDGYKHDGTSLTMDELSAQCFVFFLAGFETSSTTMTFALYELSRNQDIQDKVRSEITEVLSRYEGKITYEAINEMKYMNQVIDETLRKYPPVPFITRECIQDYKVPDEDVMIKKGIRALIPILGIHYDERYYPNPEQFDPERFSEVNKSSRHHYAHIPFGEGPRICIGMRFGLMQSKVGLTSLLRKYKFTLNKKTKVPLTFDLNSFILSAQGSVWLNVKKI